jgi:hypothetical protein
VRTLPLLTRPSDKGIEHLRRRVWVVKYFRLRVHRVILSSAKPKRRFPQTARTARTVLEGLVVSWRCSLKMRGQVVNVDMSRPSHRRMSFVSFASTTHQCHRRAEQYAGDEGDSNQRDLCAWLHVFTPVGYGINRGCYQGRLPACDAETVFCSVVNGVNRMAPRLFHDL